MNTRKRTVNKPPSDPLERLIFDRELYIKGVVISKFYGKMFIILNKGLLGITDGVLTFNLSDYPELNQASEKKLANWELIARGIGIHWVDLDEDFSLRGFILAAKTRTEKEKLIKPKNKRNLIVVD